MVNIFIFSCSKYFLYYIEINSFFLGYAFGLVLFGHVDIVSALLDHVNLWSIFVTCSILMPLYTLYKILIWSINNWSKHPIAQNLAIYCNNNNNNRMSWTTVASDINVEYQRLYIELKILFI